MAVSINGNGTVTGLTDLGSSELTVDTNTLHVDSTNNRVGVGTLTPTTALDVSGTVNATAFTGDGSSLTGIDALPDQTGQSGNYLTTDGSTASWATIASSQWTTTGSDIYYTTGNVGIGTSNPATALDVNGVISLSSGSNRKINYRSGNNDILYEFDSGDFYLQSIASSSHNWYTGNVKRAEIDSSGNFKFNSGYGSSATAYGCRAWVNFNGTGTVAIRNSGNVSSITDNGVGNYTVNFTTAMPDVNYSVCGTTGTTSNASAGWISTGSNASGYNADTTTSCKAVVHYATSNVYDATHIYISVFR